MRKYPAVVVDGISRLLSVNVYEPLLSCVTDKERVAIVESYTLPFVHRRSCVVAVVSMGTACDIVHRNVTVVPAVTCTGRSPNMKLVDMPRKLNRLDSAATVAVYVVLHC